jgi:hypothetical protein
MLERSLEYLIGELVAGARSAGGEVTHVLEHGVEAHARLLTQLILNIQTVTQCTILCNDDICIVLPYPLCLKALT